MKSVLWEQGKPLGNLSSEKVEEMIGDLSGPVIAVLDDQDMVMVFQPIDPATGLAWASEADAIAFAERYMSPPPAEG